MTSAPTANPIHRLGSVLRKDLVGGVLLLVAMLSALVIANSPWAEGYFALRDMHIGIDFPGLDHTVGEWASEGLLALFFFLVGLELKTEFVDGELNDLRKAALPVVAAFGGVAVPALIYVAVNLSNNQDPSTMQGWAIPTATDIAFAVSVLAVVGASLPTAMRTFLLTLAVVDDLIAIVIIAFFYTDDLQPQYLLLALIPLALFYFLTQRFMIFFLTRGWAAWVILLPIGVITWLFVLEAGVHATIAGVLLGFMVPVLHVNRRVIRGDAPELGLAPTLEHRFRPLANGLAVPAFAFFSAGVAVGGWDGVMGSLSDPVAIGIILGLIFGKTVGIFGSSYLMDRFTPATKDQDYSWLDLGGLSMVAGIGFTVSLLVAELSFGTGSPHNDHAKVGILTGSALAALLGGTLLGFRNSAYKKLRERGVPVDKLDTP
ncbi:Na(+)/H(+) antiporter NhaA [Kocuria dechangensis]|uniref:Na(+)/H(+) antiporter NhaA n=1 Tax=Kocuria dechangensis TaxID=1176249 RepID=A0A917LMD0_9MICC|nr:Na+/H+ antiporter NhaA [Kocuria dechangensis]GGG43297.1 Na(+)/H(+) antiporter NhaA [Kocuria dechangensis]